MARAQKLSCGLLWFDDSDKPFKQKVLEAATRHRQKYGRWPDLCHVNPAALDGMATLVAGNIKVIGLKTIRENHFWVGVQKERENGDDSDTSG